MAAGPVAAVPAARRAAGPVAAPAWSGPPASGPDHRHRRL